MRGLKLLVAVCLGAGVTFLQFAAVAALNDARMAKLDEVTSDPAPSPIVLSQPPKPVDTPPEVPPQARRTSAASPSVVAAPARASVLPALGTSNVQLGLGTVLPSLGSVELGHMNVPEVPVEPDRPARARRTVDPLYPVSAQRDGIEGYVIVRLSIDMTGRVKDVLVVDSEPIGVFERSARDAARRFEFEPARVGGTPAATTLEKRIVFSLK